MNTIGHVRATSLYYSMEDCRMEDMWRWVSVHFCRFDMAVWFHLEQREMVLTGYQFEVKIINHR